MDPPFHILNRSLWQDLERRLETHDLIDWLETHAERIAALGRTGTGAVEFSTALLRDRDIISSRAEQYLPALQIIRATPHGYAICYNPWQRPEDRRFGIAHEIAHTLWLSPDTFGRPLSPMQRAIGDDPTIEWLCNRAAAAILMPRSDLSAILTKVPSVLHLIPFLAKRYLVPERMVARRILHDLAGQDLSVFALRKDRDSAKVIWLAPTPTRGEIKKTVRGRIVPFDMLPDVPADTTSQVEVDGRWWLLLASAFSVQQARPLKFHASSDPGLALATRTEDSWYIALPSAKEH